MKAKFSLLLVLFFLTGWAAADLPRKAPLTKYQNLWNNSPFTTKPVQKDGPPPPSVLDDYALAGVSPIKGGHRVTIINKKNPEERKYVYSDEPNASHGFRIVSVERKEGDMRGTKVHMMSGDQKGTVSYDEKFLTIAAPPPPVQQKPDIRGRGAARVVPGATRNANQPGAPAANPGQQASPRAPRPRVIGPPPAPQPQPNNNTTTEQRPLRR